MDSYKLEIRDPLEIQGDSESGVDDDELGTTEKPHYLSYNLLRLFESFLGSASGIFFCIYRSCTRLRRRNRQLDSDSRPVCCGAWLRCIMIDSIEILVEMADPKRLSCSNEI